jgi:hypothetical protein
MTRQRTAPPELDDTAVPNEPATSRFTLEDILALLRFAGAIQDRSAAAYIFPASETVKIDLAADPFACEIRHRRELAPAKIVEEMWSCLAADPIRVRPHGGFGLYQSIFPTPVRSTEGTTARERALERERDELRVQVQLLQSNVAELRREVARKTRDYDQLLAGYDRSLEVLKARSEAEETMLLALLGQQTGSLRMFETYEGVVDHVHGDSVTVVFETDDDVVEHCYNRGQFVDAQLPNVGDRITVCVHVVLGSLGTPTDPASLEELDDDPGYERKRITGALEF